MPICNSRHIFAARLILAGVAAAFAAPGALTTASAAVCEPISDASMAEFANRLSEALKSRHPDHMARLFSTDSALKGFASPTVRSSYAGVREYFLYFLQFEPSVTIDARSLQSGCNFAIDTGTYTWTLKPRDAATERTAVPVRYKMTLENEDGVWKISELVEELKDPSETEAAAAFAVPAPQPQTAAVIAQKVPAVAGFLKRRADDSASHNSAAEISKAVRSSRSEAGTNESDAAKSEASSSDFETRPSGVR